MLTHKQARALERAHRLKLFFDGNLDVIATFTPFGEEVTSFGDNLKSADAASTGKQVKIMLPKKKTNLSIPLRAAWQPCAAKQKRMLLSTGKHRWPAR